MVSMIDVQRFFQRPEVAKALEDEQQECAIERETLIDEFAAAREAEGEAAKTSTPKLQAAAEEVRKADLAAEAARSRLNRLQIQCNSTAYQVSLRTQRAEQRLRELFPSEAIQALHELDGEMESLRHSGDQIDRAKYQSLFQLRGELRVADLHPLKSEDLQKQVARVYRALGRPVAEPLMV